MPSNLIKIHFEDRGQDFRWWTVDTKLHKVVTCGPRTDRRWIGVTVIDSDKLVKGDHPIYYLNTTHRSYQLMCEITRIEAVEFKHIKSTAA